MVSRAVHTLRSDSTRASVGRNALYLADPRLPLVEHGHRSIPFTASAISIPDSTFPGQG